MEIEKNVFTTISDIVLSQTTVIRRCAHDYLDDLINVGQSPFQIISQVIRGRQQC